MGVPLNENNKEVIEIISEQLIMCDLLLLSSDFDTFLVSDIVHFCHFNGIAKTRRIAKKLNKLSESRLCMEKKNSIEYMYPLVHRGVINDMYGEKEFNIYPLYQTSRWVNEDNNKSNKFHGRHVSIPIKKQFFEEKGKKSSLFLEQQLYYSFYPYYDVTNDLIYVMQL